jgi:hypothetical protein
MFLITWFRLIYDGPKMSVATEFDTESARPRSGGTTSYYAGPLSEPLGRNVWTRPGHKPRVERRDRLDPVSG